MEKQITIDLEKASEEELNSIRHDITKRLVERARNMMSEPSLYDNHGSVHANHTDATRNP